MYEVILAISGAFCTIAAFAAGFFAGKGKKDGVTPLSRQEKERLQREKQRLEEEQAAFSMLIGYNKDVAYGNGDALDGYFK